MIEQLSRGRLKDCLTVARFLPRESRRSEAPVPADVETFLGQMQETVQLAAVRLLHREIRLHGESDALTAALARGDEDTWKKTLEASLAQEDTGLDHAKARVALAERYMVRGDYKKAEPYARAAAESYAQWALLCLARCQEGLGKWDEAEKLYQASAERYENAALEWDFASRRTGKLNPTAAEAGARAYVGSLQGGVPPLEAYAVGRFYLLTDRAKDAREQFARAVDQVPTTYGALFAALLADAVGDAATRARALEKALATGRAGSDEKAVAGTIRSWAAQAEAPPAPTVNGVLGSLPPAVQADAEFLAGWLLANRGQKDRARAHWDRCVQAAEGTRWLKTHARGFLEGGQPRP